MVIKKGPIEVLRRCNTLSTLNIFRKRDEKLYRAEEKISRKGRTSSYTMKERCQEIQRKNNTKRHKITKKNYLLL